MYELWYNINNTNEILSGGWNMARQVKYLTMVIHMHGFLWWLLIGWWWRPIKYIFWVILSMLCGFRKLQIEKRY